MSSDLQARYERIRGSVRQFGQEHLLQWWGQLGDVSRDRLLRQLEELDFAWLDTLIRQVVVGNKPVELPSVIEPAPFYPSEPGAEMRHLYKQAWQLGEQLIADGKVAAFTVAGGMGTRLGFDGPKGALKISPVKDKPLFQLFAEYIQHCRRRYNPQLRWYVMTSSGNDEATRRFFRERDYFGLPEDQVVFFEQGMLPAFSAEGKILLDRKDSVSLSPDGHGGSLRAMRKSGALAEMRELGIEFISYFQVDNPLVRCIDPLFIGLHGHAGSEMSCKVLAKVDDLERVGNVVIGDGKMCVIEYSDLPEELARAKNPDGSRKFDAGSPAIQIISRGLVERITEGELQLPMHRAVKKVAYIDETGRRIEPTEPNAVKLEQFIFDAIPLANNPMALQTVRNEEFAPVKNAEGVDSVATARGLLIERAARWLERAGAKVPRKDDGKCDCVVEISPLKAILFVNRWRCLPARRSTWNRCFAEILRRDVDVRRWKPSSGKPASGQR